MKIVIQFLKDLFEYLKRLSVWLWQFRFLILFCLLFLTIFYLDHLQFGKFSTEDKVRFLGLAFELIGAGTLIYSLQSRLFAFRGHGLVGLFIKPMLNFPKWPVKRTYQMDAKTEGIATIGGTARIKRTPADKNFETLLKYIDEEINSVYQHVAQLKRSLDMNLKKLETSGEAQNKLLANEMSELRRLLNQSANSDPVMDVFGVVCVITGIILGTVPDLVFNVIY